ncbi:MmyB family transcriptional regulator, partial [Motilibacter aurantiacus]|nr:transcriptional regulator [Motilibacter aurantiacus]
MSEAVLGAVARVLRLDDVERAHLVRLAHPPGRRQQPSPQRAGEGAKRLLDLLHEAPGCVVGRAGRLLAVNPLAESLLGLQDLAPGMRNVVRHTFLHPPSRSLYADWHAVAEETAAYLRLEAGRAPHDQELQALVQEMLLKSSDFARLWGQQVLRERIRGAKRMVHPLVGELDLDYEAAPLAGAE